VVDRAIIKAIAVSGMQIEGATKISKTSSMVARNQRQRDA
jgi:hypothetical protein